MLDLSRRIFGAHEAAVDTADLVALYRQAVSGILYRDPSGASVIMYSTVLYSKVAAR